MGLFDRFKKKETPVREQETKITNMLESRSPYFGILPDGEKCTLMDFDIKQRFRHRDGSVTISVMAKFFLRRREYQR